MKGIISLIVLLFFSGCKTATIIKQNPEELYTTHGYVFMTGADTIAVEPVSGGGSQDLQKIALYSDDNAYGLWLPPGEYKVSGTRYSEWGEYPSFTVNLGKATDLGHFKTFNLGGYEEVTVSIYDNTYDQVRNAIYQNNKFISKNRVSLWDNSLVPKPRKINHASTGLGIIADLLMDYDRHVNKPSLKKTLKETKNTEAFLKLAKEGAMLTNGESSYDDQGNLYYGAFHGQIRKRANDGVWSAIDTKSLRRVSAVEVDAKTIVAGYVNGQIAMSLDLGNSWVQKNSPYKNETIYDIDKIGDFWIVASSPKAGIFNDKNSYALKFYKTADFETYDLIHKQTLGETIFASKLTVKDVATGFYFNDFDKLYYLELSSGKVKHIETPEVIHGFNVSSAKDFIVVYRAQGIFSSVFVSDNFKDWKEIDSPSYVIGNVYFDNFKKGQALRFNPGAFSVTTELYDYAPSDDDWDLVYEAPDACSNMLLDPDGKAILCITRSGSILKKSNKDWKIEFLAD